MARTYDVAVLSAICSTFISYPSDITNVFQVPPSHSKWIWST